MIAVETHIHRLLNRSGIVHATSTDVTTREIDELTPKNYNCHAHEWLIQHCLKICRARSPRCEECVIQSYCEFYAERQASGPPTALVQVDDRERVGKSPAEHPASTVLRSVCS
ncbi:endonuclease III domain-containing protein [Xanthomonas campestris]|uniref:endonuclease III domain-containing protein n=1 Tax=Xanthomonas campestris TaxID=339 RepID=UPI0036D880B8